MALAVDVIDRRDPSNEIHRQLQIKKTKIKAILAACIAAKDIYPPFITNNMKRFSFKSGCRTCGKLRNALPVIAKED